MADDQFVPKVKFEQPAEARRVLSDQDVEAPCLACTRDGDLYGGSVFFNQTLSKYQILNHVKSRGATTWTTSETDNGPWAAAGPSPGFRIGFGDYFDCDCLPDGGPVVVAWSETPNGSEPWQTWARILDPCQGLQDAVDALEDEISNLMDAFESHEIPIPRTPENVARFEAYLASLRQKLRQAQGGLTSCRAANSVAGG
jgi:hypothetical protein